MYLQLHVASKQKTKNKTNRRRKKTCLEKTKKLWFINFARKSEKTTKANVLKTLTNSSKLPRTNPKPTFFQHFFFVKIKMDSYKSLQKRSLSESSNGSEDDNYSPNFKKPRTSFYQSPGTVGLVRWPGQYTLTIILIFESKIKYC